MSGRGAAGRGRRWFVRALAVLGSLLGVGLLVAMLLPPLLSANSAEVVDGHQSFTVGDIAKLTPAEGWSVQPEAHGAMLVRSPDRVLKVTIWPATGEDPLAPDAVLEETLQNGAKLQHLTTDEGFVAVLAVGGSAMRVDAVVEPPANLAGYRVAIAELLLRIEPKG